MYSIANQNGTFPRLGWHVENEMAGVWAHPIKLFNEFHINIFEDKKIELEATKFEIEPTLCHTTFEGDKLTIIKTEFVPDDLEALVVEYKIKANEKFFGNVVFNAVANIIGTWTCEDAGFKNGDDEIYENNECNKVTIKDNINPWFASVYSFEDAKIEIENDNLYNLKFKYELKLEKDEVKVLKFILFGSSKGSKDLENTLHVIGENVEKLKEEKSERYKEIKSKSEIILDNKEVKQACEWLKYNADMMIREIPNLGRGYGAGFPHYPWWFGTDACYTIPAALSMGTTSRV